MTVEEKRANMIKAICNSDTKGIELMYSKLFPSDKPSSSNTIRGINERQFDEACIRIMKRFDDASMVVPVIAASIFAELSCELFTKCKCEKKEDK